MVRLIKNFHIPNWLVLVLVIVLVLRIPSFFEPFSYGDEMIYLTLGNGIRHGLVLYKQLHDNKPPMIYILAAIAGNVFWFRVMLAAWNAATIVIFWKLAQRLSPKNNLFQKVSTFLFAVLTTIPLFEGQTANSEVFMIGPTILAIYLLLSEKLRPKKIVIAGLLLGLAALFKIPAAFDAPAIVLFWLVSQKLTIKSIRAAAIKTIPLVIGFTAVILVTVVWYWLRGGLGDYISAAFGQNVGYLSSWRGDTIKQSFLVKNGPLLIRGAIVAISILLLYLARKKLSKPFLLSSIWLTTSLFAATLSERPYPHYLMQAVPPLAILLGLFVASKTKEQVWALFPLTLFFVVPVYYKFWYYNSSDYYSRFLSYALGQTTKEQYFNRFDANTARNYELAKFIMDSSTTDNRIFVWGDTATIYALSRRLPPIKFVADYHINDFANQSRVAQSIAESRPKLIVITPQGRPFGELNRLISASYTQINDFDGAKIFLLVATQN